MFGMARADGDWLLNSAGQRVRLKGRELLEQDVGLGLSCPYDPEEDQGCRLIAAQKGGDAPILLSRNSVDGEVSAAIDRLQRAQAFEPYLTDAEAVDRITRLIVIIDDVNKTDLLFSVTVASRDGDDVRVQKAVNPNQQTAYQLPPNQSVRSRIGS